MLLPRHEFFEIYKIMNDDTTASCDTIFRVPPLSDKFALIDNSVSKVSSHYPRQKIPDLTYDLVS